MNNNDDYDYDYLDGCLERWAHEAAVKKRKKNVVKSLVGIVVLGAVGFFSSAKEQMYNKMPELNTVDSVYFQDVRKLQRTYVSDPKNYDGRAYIQKMENLKKQREFKTDSIKEIYKYNSTGS